MKRASILLLFTATFIALSAIPAKRIKKEISTTNGTTINATLTGDEYLHFWLGEDGKKYLQNADDKYEEFDTETFNACKSRALKKKASQNDLRSKRIRASRKKTASNFRGSKKGLVILVNFSDIKINAANSRAEFDDMFNKVGYNKGGHIGSAHDYFKDQSYGNFDLTFDVIGPVTVSKNQSYYGRNLSGIDGNDAHPGEMLIEACKLADSEVNFKDYDWDGDGYVEQVYIIFAGYTEAQGGSTNTIWAHQSTLNDCKDYNDGTGELTLDGVKIDTYACSSELRGDKGTVVCPIGTACHEFSHCLGYPDVYDTEYNGGFAMDAWDIMSCGNFNGPYGYGEVPSGFTAYERNLAGWLDYKILDKGQKITNMAALTDSPEAYIIYNDANKNEYYILENRQLSSWDSYQYGHGMLVVHVDYDAKIWEENTINNDPKHQRYNIIPADNQFMTGYDEYGYYALAEDLEGDPFPGTTNAKSLTDTSTPAATLYNSNVDGRKFMGKPIENITESKGLISFTFMGGTSIDAPTAKEATDIENNAFTARWTSVDKADSYTIELREKTQDTPENNIVLAEDFTGFSSYTSDGTNDISSSLNNYMQKAGWTGYKVFTSSKQVKIGSSKTNGYITTPSISTPSSGTFTVAITAKSYSSETNTTVKINNESITITPEENTYIVHLKDVSSDTNIKIAPSARIYVSQVNVYDGEFSFEDLTSETATGSIQTITGITDTCYTFTNLTGNCYSYKVKAVNSETESQWSNAMTVDLTTAQLKGDINLDGNVNIGDLTQLISLVMSNYSTKDELFNRANLNNDESINVGDVTQLISLIMSFEAKP